MEDINIGDVVFLKGITHVDAKFTVCPNNTYTTNTENQHFALFYVCNKTGRVERIWRVPVACITKIPSHKVKYVIDPNRDPHTLVPGDIVSLKSQPETKLLVKEVGTSGKDVTVFFFDVNKGEIGDLSNLAPEVFNVYEMIVLR